VGERAINNLQTAGGWSSDQLPGTSDGLGRSSTTMTIETKMKTKTKNRAKG
jgi:hypothetical protein